MLTDQWHKHRLIRVRSSSSTGQSTISEAVAVLPSPKQQPQKQEGGQNPWLPPPFHPSAQRTCCRDGHTDIWALRRHRAHANASSSHGRRSARSLVGIMRASPSAAFRDNHQLDVMQPGLPITHYRLCPERVRSSSPSYESYRTFYAW